MARPVRKRKCRQCQAFFVPDPRCVKRQRYCSKLECRKASKTARQQRWRHQPANRDYFTGPTHTERVRTWRQAHPGYWRRKRSKPPHTLQDESTPKPIPNQSLSHDLGQGALQDELFRQPTVLVGLISQLSGYALQDDIVMTTRRLQQLGRDILDQSSLRTGDDRDGQTPHFTPQAAPSAAAIQLGGSTPGP